VPKPGHRPDENAAECDHRAFTDTINLVSGPANAGAAGRTNLLENLELWPDFRRPFFDHVTTTITYVNPPLSATWSTAVLGHPHLGLNGWNQLLWRTASLQPITLGSDLTKTLQRDHYLTDVIKLVGDPAQLND